MAEAEIQLKWTFDAAHWLPGMGMGHPCRNTHGHTYHVAMTWGGRIVEGEWVKDFAEIHEAIDPVIAALDHKELNGIKGLSWPTVERVAVWLWEEAARALREPQLLEVRVSEGEAGTAIYRGVC